jgi:hypothetical protein
MSMVTPVDALDPRSRLLSLSLGGVIISAAVHDGLSESVHRYFVGALLAIALAAVAVWKIKTNLSPPGEIHARY